MKIHYADDGRILGIYASHLQIPGNILEVSEKDLKKDFRATFGLGKYRVEKGEIKAVRGFRRPGGKALQAPFGVTLQPPQGKKS